MSNNTSSSVSLLRTEDYTSKWKIEEHQMERFDFLAGKIDALRKNRNSEKVTKEEMVEFCKMWWRDGQYNITNPLIKAVTEKVNDGDPDIFFK